MNPNLPFFLKVLPFLIISGGLTKKVPSMISTGKPRFSAPASQEITPGKYTMSYLHRSTFCQSRKSPRWGSFIERKKYLKWPKIRGNKGERRKGGRGRKSESCRRRRDWISRRPTLKTGRSPLKAQDREARGKGGSGRKSGSVVDERH